MHKISLYFSNHTLTFAVKVDADLEERDKEIVT